MAYAMRETLDLGSARDRRFRRHSTGGTGGMDHWWYEIPMGTLALGARLNI